MEDIDTCSHKFCAEEQRKSEVERYGTDEGVQGYKLMGCYECDGRNKRCYAYTHTSERKKQ